LIDPSAKLLCLQTRGEERRGEERRGEERRREESEKERERREKKRHAWSHQDLPLSAALSQ
jgi:hypothetical protein